MQQRTRHELIRQLGLPRFKRNCKVIFTAYCTVCVDGWLADCAAPVQIGIHAGEGTALPLDLYFVQELSTGLCNTATRRRRARTHAVQLESTCDRACLLILENKQQTILSKARVQWTG